MSRNDALAWGVDEVCEGMLRQERRENSCESAHDTAIENKRGDGERDRKAWGEKEGRAVKGRGVGRDVSSGVRRGGVC